MPSDELGERVYRITNPPDDCLVCGDEYDLLIEAGDNSNEGALQTQGKANICWKQTGVGTVLFLHFTEKYV